MAYQVLVARKVEKHLAKIPQDDHDRIQATIDALADDPRPVKCDKLRLNAGFKIRVGNHRVLYRVDDDEQVVRVYRVGDRKDVYR